MSYGLYDLVGIVGVALVVGSYLALQLERLASGALSYSVLNALGAALILVSLLHEFNLSAFVIEAFWLAISLVGVVRDTSARRRPS